MRDRLTNVSLLVAAFLVAGCLGHLNLDGYTLPTKDPNSTIARQQAEYYMCIAYRDFYEQTEKKLRAWNTFTAIATGILGLASGGSGIGSAAASDTDTKNALAITSAVGGLLSVVTLGVTVWSSTSDHKYVRASGNNLDKHLTTAGGPSADLWAKCEVVVTDANTPNPDPDEKKALRQKLQQQYNYLPAIQ